MKTAIKSILVALAIALTSCGNSQANQFAQKIVDEANQQLPQSSEIYTANKARINQQQIVFPLAINPENNISLKDIPNTEALKHNLISMLKTSSQSSIDDLHQLADYGYSVTYQITDSYGQILDITLTPADLATL